MKTQSLFRSFLMYVAIFFAFVLFNIAKIGGTISPFSFAFLFALLYLNKNEFVVASLFVVSYVLTFQTLLSAVIALFAGVVAILVCVFHKTIKKRMTMPFCMFYLILSQAVFVTYNVSSANEVLQVVATLILSVIFLYMTSLALSAVANRGMYAALAFDENVCLGVVISALALGLVDIYICGVWLLSVFVVFFAQLILFVLGSNHALYFVAMCGVGVCFGNVSIVPLAIFVSYGVAMIAIKDAGRLATSLSIVVVDFVIGALLNGYATYTIFNVVSICLGCFLFCLIPQKGLQKLKTYVGADCVSYADSVVSLRCKNEIRKKLSQSSNVFYCLSDSVKNLVCENISQSDAKTAICSELNNKICSKCEMFAECRQNSFKNTQENFELLVDSAFAKGKVSVVDIPPLLATYCNKITSVLALVNEDVVLYKNFCGKMQEENKGKIEMAEQFFQTGNMLQFLSAKIGGEISRNINFEKAIKQELLLYDVLAKEVSVFENKNGISNVVVVVRNESKDSLNIKKVLKQVLKVDLKLEKKEFAEVYGWSVLSFVLAPKFDAVIGVAKTAKQKNEVSGDTFQVLSVGENKIMAIICDGMGNGEEASKISKIALSIIENFYKAGYATDFILKNVNRFLNYSNKDIFTSVDICVIDTMTAHTDFLKLGSSLSVIKKQNKCLSVLPQALPVGIVEDIKIKNIKTVLEVGDIVVLASDGIVDSFSSPNQFVAFVNNLRIINAQLIADSILEQAKFNYKNANKDDMSVIVIRLISCA